MSPRHNHKPGRRLTARRASLSPSAGHAVPTRRVLSARRVESDEHQAGRHRCACAPGKTAGTPRTSLFLFRPLREAAGLGPRKTRHRLPGPLAPLEARQGAAAALHRSDARSAAPAGHAPDRHRPRLRHRRLRAGDVDDAGRPARHLPRLGEFRRGLGDRRGKAAESGAERAPRRLRPAAGSLRPPASVSPTATGSPRTARA